MLNGEVSKGRQLANFRVSVLGTKRKQSENFFFLLCVNAIISIGTFLRKKKHYGLSLLIVEGRTVTYFY